MINPVSMDEAVVFRERFAARLRALRQELGLTPRELAERIGCRVGQINKLERCAAWVSDAMLVKLRKAFRLDEVDFFVFPDANPLRHGIYDLLRGASEEVLLKTKLFVLDELRRHEMERPSLPAGEAASDSPKPAFARHKR